MSILEQISKIITKQILNIVETGSLRKPLYQILKIRQEALLSEMPELTNTYLNILGLNYVIQHLLEDK